MFKLNRMTDYAIVILGVLAQRQGSVLAAAHIATVTGLSQPTVAKVAKMLAGVGLLTTQRGAFGGYQIACTAKSISLVQIIEAIEGPIVVNDCVDGAKAPCMVTHCCGMSETWKRVNLAIRNALDDVYLEDVIGSANLFAPHDDGHAADQPASVSLPANIS